MQLRYTKGVGIALAIAAGCALLGFAIAPGWWFFAAASVWLAFLLAAGGAVEGEISASSRGQLSEPFLGSDRDLSMDPSLRNSYAGNVFSNSDLYP